MYNEEDDHIEKTLELLNDQLFKIEDKKKGLEGDYHDACYYVDEIEENLEYLTEQEDVIKKAMSLLMPDLEYTNIIGKLKQGQKLEESDKDKLFASRKNNVDLDALIP